ncbi:MAG: hypothetical protein AB2L18_09020 [Anaerolineaceae bacterium]
MNKKEFIAWLIVEFNYSERAADLLFEKFENATPKIKDAIILYKENRTIPTMIVEGYTVKNLMTDYKMNFLAAILNLEWIEHEPEVAKKMLKKGLEQPLKRT